MWRRWRRRWQGHGYHECPCRGRACPARSLTVESPLTVCFVGRGLDPSATSRETAVNGISVGEGFIPPVYLPSPLTSAGRRGRRPLQRRSVNLPPPYTPAAARGLAALRPPVTMIRKGKVHPSRAACSAATLLGPGMPGPQPCRCRLFIFCIAGSGLDRSVGRRGRRPLQRQSVNLPPPHTPAGGYGIRPYAQTKPPRRGRACPARSLAVAAPLSFAS